MLNRYQAAAFIGLSPELLLHLTTHRVKWQDPRKLVVAKYVKDEPTFTKAELTSYDTWLRARWPSKDGQRPPMPPAIREEIRIEANLECALCRSSGEAGEAAHINPVATSKSNHPSNLIWLCSTHHTKLDNGCFGPTGADNQIIAALKIGLHHFKRMSWQGQADISKSIAGTLALCRSLNAHLVALGPAGADRLLEVNALKRLAKKALKQLPTLATKSKSLSEKPTLSKLKAKLAETKQKSTSKRLATASSFEADYLKASGLVQCPLCKGKTTYSGFDCRVCSGDGVVSKDLHVDLSEFELIDCTLCSGSGLYLNETCPPCVGDGKLERGTADRTDFSQFDLVNCPVCKGRGGHLGEDCQACFGDRKMLRRTAELIDPDDYSEVDCPLCEGEGRYDGDDCPECKGDKKMQKQHADRVDVTDYKKRQCPICKGTTQYEGLDCPACNAEGEMTAAQARDLDHSQYELVRCPQCKGCGTLHDNDCPGCNGTKKIPRRFADQF